MDRNRVTVTISIRPEVLATARLLVARGHASSLSAWVEEAMTEKADNTEMAELLAGMPALAPAADPVEPAQLEQLESDAPPLPRRSAARSGQVV